MCQLHGSYFELLMDLTNPLLSDVGQCSDLRLDSERVYKSV